MNTPIQTMQLWIREQGLLDEWESSNGATQEPFIPQLRLFNETVLDSDSRCLLIKISGSGGGNRYVSKPTILFSILGKVGENAVYAEEFANKVYAALLDFEFADSVISIDPLGGVNGALLTESNRPVYDMEFTTKIDSGHLAAGAL